MTALNAIESAPLLDLVTRLLSKLETLTGEIGLPKSLSGEIVDKNIVQGTGSTFTKRPKVNPNLIGNEQRAVRNVAYEFARTFYEYNLKKKGDEAKPATLISNINEKQIQPTVATNQQPKSNTEQGVSLLLLAAGVIAAAGAIWTYLGPIGAFITKFALKLPRLLQELRTSMTTIKSFVEVKWPSLFRAFESVAGLTTSLKNFFRLKWTAFKNSFRALGAGLDSIGNLFKAAKPVEDIGKSASQASKTLKPVLETTGRTVGTSLLKRIKFIPFIGSLASFTFAYFRFKEGQWVRGTIELLSGLFNLSGVLWPISLMLDGMLIVYDLLESKNKTTAATTSLKAGKLLIKPVLTNIATKIGGKMLKTLKFIPFIGALANFAAAYIRFKDGQWVRGTFEIVAGLLSLGGPTHALAMIIDGALILYDMMEIKGTETGKAAVITKSITKGVIPMLKALGTKLGVKFLSVAKFIPVIGGLANIALGFYRIQKGEWVAGIFEFISGICDFIPGYGTIASYVIDGGLILYDLLKTSKGNTNPLAKPTSKDAIGELQKTESSFSSKLIGALWYVPVISSAMYLGRGISKLVNGNVSEGLLDLARSIPAIFGGKGLIDSLEYVAGLFIPNPSKTSNAPAVKAKEFSLINTIGEMIDNLAQGIISGIGNFITNTKNAITNYAKNAYNSVEKKIFGESSEQLYDDAQRQTTRQGRTDASVSTVISARKQGLGMEKWDAAAFNTFLSKLKVNGYTTQHDELLKAESAIRDIYNKSSVTKDLDYTAIQKAQQNLTSLYSDARKLINLNATQPEQQNFTKMFNELDRLIEIKSSENGVPAPIVEVSTQQFNLDTQNSLINRQTNVLSEMLLVSKQQLAAAKDKPQAVVVQGGNNAASSVNMNNAFSTFKNDSRSMYNGSPYSLNVT